MKKTVLIFMVLVFLFSVPTMAAPIYTGVSEELVTEGVTLKKEERFFGDSSLSITLVTADLKNEDLSLELLKKSGGVDKTDTVMNHAKTNENTVAAINADFFSTYKGTQNFSLGIEVKDGKLLQSHINPNMAAGFFEGGILSLSYIDFSMTITAPDGTQMPVAHMNKPTDYYGAVLMYTPEFNGGTSPFLPNGITALTVTGDTVSSKGTSLGGTIPIPEDGYILVIDDRMTPFLEYKFNIGDPVELKISAAPSIENVQTAFGGGTLLLKDGEKTKITHDVSGRNPRSVIGTNDDGTVIYMMTVDGRQTVSKGVTLSELAGICKEMGMANAINLDGGGSTAMVGKTLENNTLHKFNSPSENRKVINSVAVTNNAERGPATGILCEPEEDSVLSGDSVKINVTPHDENYNVPTSSDGTVTWDVPAGKGYVKDNVYYPQGNGEVTVDAYYNGKKTDSFTVNVISSVTGIIAAEEISAEVGKEIPLSGKVKVFDEKGNVATVKDISLLNPSYDRSILSLSNGKAKLLSKGATELALSHSGAHRSIEVASEGYSIDIRKPVTTDSMNRERNVGASFNIYASSEMNTLFDRVVYVNAMDVLEKSDVSAVVGGDKPADITPANSPVMAGEYIERSYSHSKIVSMQMRNGIISRGTQWQKLSDALNSSQKNIFVILDRNPLFSTEIDRNAFYSMLSEAAKTKNVFVITIGSENFCRIEDGVRYITVANVRDENTLQKSVDNVCYLSFDITSDNATYTFKNLFNN